MAVLRFVLYSEGAAGLQRGRCLRVVCLYFSSPETYMCLLDHITSSHTAHAHYLVHISESHNSFHPRNCVVRLYVPTEERRRGLISVEDCVNQERMSLESYVQATDGELLKTVSREGVEIQETAAAFKERESVGLRRWESETRKFGIYFKPKIHKPNHPGRPFVSACSCPAELISSYLDKIMAPIVKSLPLYMKKSNHALDILRTFNFSGENKFIFTMDITSVYTVIPNNEGLQALKYFLI